MHCRRFQLCLVLLLQRDGRSHGRCGHLSLTPPRLGQLKVVGRLTRTGRLQSLVKVVIYLDNFVNALSLTQGQRLVV